VSGTHVTAPATGDTADFDEASGGPGAAAGRGWRAPVNLVILAMTVLALGVRLFYLTRPGYLLGVTEYDDGSYFGSAVRLVHGVLPYRDFVFVQPPGITLLMTPVAAVSRLTGTDAGLAIARVLTMAAGAAGVALAGLLVRHRGALAALVVCGLMAVYPDSVASAHTLLVEPWLVLFCLAGAVAVFDGEKFTGSWRRLAWGGASFGFAGVIEAWAIVPVLVIAVLSVRQVRRTAVYLAGVVAGFAVPVLPFAALAPQKFYDAVITAQVGGRAGAARVGIWERLRQMSGFANQPHIGHPPVLAVIALMVGFAVLACLLLLVLARQLPPLLEWFAYGTAVMVVAIFLWPAQFHYHFSGFLAPWLGLALALPAARLVAALRARGAAAPRLGELAGWAFAGLAAAAIIAASVNQFSFESALRPVAKTASMAAGERIIPPGACVLADNVAYTITANRFVNSVPGCPTIDDGTGANFALAHGLSALTGAGRVPAVAAMWRAAFTHAQYVWLTPLSSRRIAWNPALRAYFSANFTRVPDHTAGLHLWVRNGLTARH
jgi:alpha-1,2-mannosyltransferase